MIKKLAPSLILLCALTAHTSFATFANPTSIGERITIQSKVLNEERPLQILLPESYHNNKNSHYPVIYLLDGDYNFHAVSGMLDLLSNKGQLIPDVILVGIADKGTDQYRQYMTPEGSSAPRTDKKGKASEFLSFLNKDLKPYLASHYRVSDDATLVGHSMGGLFVLNALLESPQTFNSYVAISPSVWLSDHALVKKAKEQIGKSKHDPVSLYLSLGDETQMGQYGFIHLLDDAQPDNIHWQFTHYPDENHSSVGIISLRDSLKKRFKDWFIAEKALAKIKSPERIIEHYQKQLATFNTNQAIPNPSIRTAIRYFYRKKKVAELPAFMAKVKQLLPASEQAFIVTRASYVGHYDSPQAALLILKADESRFEDSIEYIKSIASTYEQLKDSKMAYHYYEKALTLAKTHKANQWQINIIEAKLLANKTE